MAEERGTVLVLEDDEGVTHLVRLRLERLGYVVVSATTPDDALGLIERGGVDLVVLDYRLRGDVSGLDFYRQLQAAGHDIPAILVTGFSDEGKLIEAIRAGVRDFVPKTTDFLDYLPPAIDRVMSQVRTKRQAAESEAVRQTNAQLQLLIAERQRLEKELRASNEQLVEADRRKDEFLAMLAHELRNPLAAVSNCITLLKRPGSEQDHSWCQETIDRQVQHLSRLIDDLLDVSRITRGKIQLQKQPLDLHDVAVRAATVVRPMIEERGQTLTLDLATGPLRLEADPTRVEQILVNLLSNAAKYTDRGGRITLSAQDDGRAVVIAVKDTGVGLAPDMLARIFELFAQVDHSLARSQGGLGIGLTLVQTLTELHGGSVEARSEGLGKGSEFIVRLPRAASVTTEPTTARPRARTEATTHESGSITRRRVLVVDDSVDTARGMTRFLKISGYDAESVHDGPAALEAVASFHPDAVLLDIGLPGRDGYEIARAIRDGAGGEHVFLIAVSGYAQERDRERATQAGFNHHLVKPVNLDALLALLSESNEEPSGTALRAAME